MFRSLPTYFISVILVLMLGACSKGVNKSLVTDKGIDIYKASLAVAVKDMTPKDVETFNWAVSDLSLDDINTRYPNQSPRQIVRGEVKLVQTNAPSEIAALEKELAAWTPQAAEISKVIASDVSFSLEQDFFGLQPHIKATVHNGSKFSYSILSWRAELYLNGGKSPVATSEQFDDYRSVGGLASGAEASREMTVGFVKGDQTWSTLEVQNATERKVKLTVIPSQVKDFSEHHLVNPSPETKLNNLKKTLATAMRLKDF